MNAYLGLFLSEWLCDMFQTFYLMCAFIAVFFPLCAACCVGVRDGAIQMLLRNISPIFLFSDMYFNLDLSLNTVLDLLKLH